MFLHQNHVDSSLTDEQIITLIETDVNKAFQEMYNKYWWVLYKFAFVRLKDQDLAQHVVQDVFTSIWKTIRSLHITTSLPAYLFSSARNQIYITIKKQNLFSKYLEHAADNRTSLTTDPDLVYQANELEKALNEKMTELPIKAREVFLLSRNHGMNTRQISEFLKISPRTVETHIHNCLKILRLVIKPKF
jgi:RNA polymerase sigma-70 factor (family 1)